MLAFFCPRTHHSLVEALIGPVSAWGGGGGVPWDTERGRRLGDLSSS